MWSLTKNNCRIHIVHLELWTALSGTVSLHHNHNAMEHATAGAGLSGVLLSTNTNTAPHLAILASSITALKHNVEK